MELPSLEQGKGMILGTKGDTQLDTRLHEGYQMKVHTAAHWYKHEEEKLHKGAVTEQTYIEKNDEYIQREDSEINNVNENVMLISVEVNIPKQ